MHDLTFAPCRSSRVEVVGPLAAGGCWWCSAGLLAADLDCSEHELHIRFATVGQLAEEASGGWCCERSRRRHRQDEADDATDDAAARRVTISRNNRAHALSAATFPESMACFSVA
jgi:hypothetical protein